MGCAGCVKINSSERWKKNLDSRDSLLIETAPALHFPLKNVEGRGLAHEWSRTMFQNNFRETALVSPFECDCLILHGVAPSLTT
jgi:hypothetical protein